MSGHAYTEDQLVEQPATGGKAEGSMLRAELLPPEAIAAAISGIGRVSPSGEMALFSETPAQTTGHGSGHKKRQESGFISANGLFSSVNTDNEPDIYADI